MKQFYKSKSLLRLSFLFVLLFSVITVVNSCKKDDDDEYTDHVVQFEVKTTTGGVIRAIVTQVGTVKTDIFDPVGTTWGSGEFFVNSSQAQLNLAAKADLPDANSELIVNLWIDGEIVRTKKMVGAGPLVASVNYSFLEL
ncbi:hypothetical protein [Chryseobacterium vrystaatense]|uniref:Uncharacterized protein n=1 Tax=Chryseobacterium vrystaatense TaxID=307480 RepID=A0A1M5AB08_9FLAO|nr:hypothetical protein [Chryseobacterium vrystaatense]KFF26969.1 hypothetical protein IW16_06775 [Chryseobacterium vrystaatense]SHF27453.1 hypothetical protein SAMN02787073_1864 [Chryseobacterium vrystaatense]